MLPAIVSLHRCEVEDLVSYASAESQRTVAPSAIRAKARIPPSQSRSLNPIGSRELFGRSWGTTRRRRRSALSPRRSRRAAPRRSRDWFRFPAHLVKDRREPTTDGESRRDTVLYPN